MEDVLAQYEKGLQYLVEQLGEGHPRLADALTMQARFLENIAAVRRWGETEALRAERARLVASLNQLTNETLGASFNEVRAYCQATEIKEQIEKLESLRSVLGDQTTDQNKSELEHRLRSLLESAGSALVSGSLDTRGGTFVGRDQSTAIWTERSVIVGGNTRGLVVITGDGNTVTLSPDYVPVESLLEAYYRSVAAECGRLPMGVIDPTYVLSSDESSVALSDVYVDPEVLVSKPTAAHDVSMTISPKLEGREPERISLMKALANPQLGRVVLLGDPGSGKTTFVNHLAFLLATNSPMLPKSVRGHPLVWLNLRVVAAGHISPETKRGTASVLWSALAEDISARLGAEASRRLLPHLQRRLLHEGGVILLDGLDEVPEAYQRRRALIEAVHELSITLPGTRSLIVVTSRPYAYADPRWRLPGFSVLALAPFSQEQTKSFVERWYEAVRVSMGWNSVTACSESEQFQSALHERAYLADLASRPLLLTLMVALHSSWGRLPGNRADLYEGAVRLFLGRWERAREIRSPDGELVVEPGIAQVLGVGEEGVRAALEALAFGAHERQSRILERDFGPADITESELLVAFKPLLGALPPAALLHYLTDRAGLLVSLGEGVFAFPHLAFQEYLAACYLSSRPDCGEALSFRVRTDPIWWQEVFLLAVARARTGSLSEALSLLNFMLPESPHEGQTNLELDWQIVSLVCRAVLDVLPFPAADAGHLSDASSRVYGTLMLRLREWLRYLIQPSVALPEPEQVEALEAAAQLFPETMPEKPLFLARLADARYARYLTRGNLADLETAILFYKQVRARASADDPRQSQWADSLASAMQTMYDHSAELDYLRASIEQYQFSVSAATSDATYRVRARRNMANAHLRLYQATRQLDCLQDAITAYREAIAETPPGMESALALQAELTPLLRLFNQQAFFSLWDDFTVENRALRIRQFCEEASRTTHVPLVSFEVLPEGKGFLGVLDLSEMLRGVPVPQLSRFPILFMESCSGGEDLAYIRGVLADHLGPNCRRALLVPFRNASALTDLLDSSMRQVHAYDLICVSRSDLERVLIDGQPGDSLRRMIVSRVDLASLPVYQVAGPTPDNLFFGRERELQEICDHVASVNYLLVGGRRIGKSSILKRLQRVRLPDAGLDALYHDCSYTVGETELVEAVINDRSWFPKVVPNAPSSFAALVDMLPNTRPLVVLLDETDSLIAPDRAAGYRLFNTFRALSQSGRCRFVLCGEQNLRTELMNPDSPLYNFATPMRVGRLDYYAVEELVTQPMRQLEVELSDKEAMVQRIWSFTSGHPNIVQRLCRRLILRLSMRRSRQLRSDDIEDVVEDPDFLRNDFLHVYWERATVLERLCSLVMVIKDEEQTLAGVYEALSQHDVRCSLLEVDAALERLVDLRNILNRTPAGYAFAATAFPKVIAGTARQSDLVALNREFYERHGDIDPHTRRGEI